MPQGNEIHGRKSRRILQAVTYICLQRAEASVSSASVNVNAFCGYIDQEVAVAGNRTSEIKGKTM